MTQMVVDAFHAIGRLFTGSTSPTLPKVDSQIRYRAVFAECSQQLREILIGRDSIIDVQIVIPKTGRPICEIQFSDPDAVRNAILPDNIEGFAVVRRPLQTGQESLRVEDLRRNREQYRFLKNGQEPEINEFMAMKRKTTPMVTDIRPMYCCASGQIEGIGGCFVLEFYNLEDYFDQIGKIEREYKGIPVLTDVLLKMPPEMLVAPFGS